MQKNQNRHTGPYGRFVFIGLILAMFVHAAPVLVSVSPKLTTDVDVATAGYYRLNWEAEEASVGDEVGLQESTTANFENPKVIYKGPDLAAVISGKSNGKYFYRVRRAQPDGPQGLCGAKRAT
jgi:hypothetical protein